MLTLFTLGSAFGVASKVDDVFTVADAMPLVREHLEGSGYVNVRTVDDGDGSIRFIADPPHGRKGRNVASLDIW